MQRIQDTIDRSLWHTQQIQLGFFWNNGGRGEEWMWFSEVEICTLVDSYSCLRPFKRVVFFLEVLKLIYSVRWELFCVHEFRLASIQPPFLDVLLCIKTKHNQHLILNILVRGASGIAGRIHSILKESETRSILYTQGTRDAIDIQYSTILRAAS